MPVAFERSTAGAAPLLLARPEGAEGPLPAVLWFHGLGVDKETHRAELERLAGEGFLAVGVDAAGHGERRLPDLQERIDEPREVMFPLVLRLATETAGEVPSIVRALVESGRADPERIALAGISFGAYVVYRALVETRGIRAAVAILGSPEWPHPASPHLHLDALRRVPLLSITAEHDENVPPGPARELHRRLAEPAPGARPARYLELPGGVHLMSAEHWETTLGETMRWLALHAR